ncbi:hypothetical protein [Iamia sp.]|uniref:hypothetical protein n=1 Tax=Iamia sp. TaxID=2722710 RepID=UPI002BB2C3E8|nr:hypothetical protein [Iamia sp.]HXH57027.1 hypothetical protein [Iamia sp.]
MAGRIGARRDLAERLTDRRLTAGLGPRRYGKTSLLLRIPVDAVNEHKALVAGVRS